MFLSLILSCKLADLRISLIFMESTLSFQLPFNTDFCFLFKKIYIYIYIYLFIIYPHQVLVGSCGVYFPDQGSNLGPLHWECGVLATGPPGKSQWLSFYTFHQFHCRMGLWNFLGCHSGNLSPAMIFNLMLVFLLVCYSLILLFESGKFEYKLDIW